MKICDIPEKEWYKLAQEGTVWKNLVGRGRTGSSTTGDQHPLNEKQFRVVLSMWEDHFGGKETSQDTLDYIGRS